MIQLRRAIIASLAALALTVGGASALGVNSAFAAQPTAPNPKACANSQGSQNANANAKTNASPNSAVNC